MGNPPVSPLPDGLLRELGGIGLHFDASGQRARVTSQALHALLGRQSPCEFSVTLQSRDLVRLLNLMRQPSPWLRFDVTGYYRDQANRIVEIDSLVATWDRWDEAVDLIATTWAWATAEDPTPGERFLLHLDAKDALRIDAIRRYWAAGVRPADLAPRYHDAGIGVEEALILQQRPEQWADIRTMVDTLAGMLRRYDRF